MVDYSSNMTLGEKNDMRQKLRMAQTMRSSFPYEKSHIIFNDVSKGEYCTTLDLELSPKEEKIATMLDLYEISKQYLEGVQKVCFSFDTRKLHS